ncbi:MAG: hypothetical protein EP305_00040 [Bacteroidetes bacterium]|nr:MAG: hypothetical protein EP305_00040 [Bacteroidota bacterium]
MKNLFLYTIVLFFSFTGFSQSKENERVSIKTQEEVTLENNNSEPEIQSNERTVAKKKSVSKKMKKEQKINQRTVIKQEE